MHRTFGAICLGIVGGLTGEGLVESLFISVLLVIAVNLYLWKMREYENA